MCYEFVTKSEGVPYRQTDRQTNKQYDSSDFPVSLNPGSRITVWYRHVVLWQLICHTAHVPSVSAKRNINFDMHPEGGETTNQSSDVIILKTKPIVSTSWLSFCKSVGFIPLAQSEVQMVRCDSSASILCSTVLQPHFVSFMYPHFSHLFPSSFRLLLFLSLLY